MEQTITETGALYALIHHSKKCDAVPPASLNKQKGGRSLLKAGWSLVSAIKLRVLVTGAQEKRSAAKPEAKHWLAIGSADVNGRSVSPCVKRA